MKIIDIFTKDNKVVIIRQGESGTMYYEEKEIKKNLKKHLTNGTQCAIIIMSKGTRNKYIKEVIKMTREQIINTLKANTTVENNKAFAVVLYKKNFYTKRVFNDIITTVDTYEQANALVKELKSKFANELKECDAKITFATTDLFTRGYSYKFAKQS